MKIKRTFAKTMREALQLVKQEQGMDAVILGNKKVTGGVELISAIDYDEGTVAGLAAASSALPARFDSKPSHQSTDVAADVWVTEAGHSSSERKEPVLGPIAGEFQKPQARMTKIPDWVEQELLRSKQQEAENTRAPMHKAVPISAPVFAESSTQVKTPEPKSKKISTADTAPQPVIDEVKQELKGLRDLMEGQLSVLQWDRFSQSHPVRTVLLTLMSEMGLGSDVCHTVISHLDQLGGDPHQVWQQALGIIANCIPISRRDLLVEGGRIALVGSTGVGKTTTIAKLAARFAHIHGKRSVATISTDHFRVGAQEQLQHFTKLLEVPMLTASNSEELADRLDMLSDKKLVLIDTAGMSQQDVRLSEQFHQLQQSAPQVSPYLVLSANTQLAALHQTIQSFSKVQIAGALVTKLDESGSLGGIITSAIRHQLKLAYCGTGQRVPEDLEIAKKHRIISKAVQLMQHYGERTDREALALRYNHIIRTNQA